MIGLYGNILLTLDFGMLPTHLETRVTPSSYFLIGSMFLGFCLLAVTSLLRPGLLYALAQGNSKISGIKSFVKDTYPFTKLPGILLLFNFIVVSIVFTAITLDSEMNQTALNSQFAFLIPVIYFLWELISMLVVGVLSGELKMFAESLIIRLMGAQLLGVILWLCVLFYAIRPEFGHVIILIGIGFFILEMLSRSFRSILNVYRIGGAWYYLILYFCTLEILPLFVVGYIFVVK